jgi:hypothetical protein
VGSKREKSNPTAVELWELKLLKEVARQFRTEDREFLETELLSRLVELKSKPKRHVRQWKNYLWTALWNHAANFMRDRPMIHKTHLDPVESGAEDFEEDHTVGIVLPSLELSLDRQIAFSEVRKELGPKLRRLCELLEEKNGNQVAVARRLRKHRNTIRLWIGRIRKGFKRHGYPQR